MEPVILVIHLFLALGIIVLVLLQRSEGGGLGLSGGGLGSFSTARGTANALTKMTAILAAGFFLTSLTLGVMASHNTSRTTGILADVKATDVQTPAETAPGITYTPPEEPIPAINPNAPIDIEKVPEEVTAAPPSAPEKALEEQPAKQPEPTAPVSQ